MKSKNIIFKSIKKYLSNLKNFDLHFYGTDSSDMHKFKVGNYECNFAYSYAAESYSMGGGYNSEPDLNIKIYNLEVSELEISLYGSMIELDDDQFMELEELIKNIIQNEIEKNYS